MTETPDEQLPDETPADAASGYAVYDDTLLRYVGGKHATKSAANKAKRELPDGSYTVRQV